MRYVGKSPYMGYCELCGKGSEEFIEVNQFKSVCVKCATELSELIPSKTVIKKSPAKRVR